MASEVQVRVWCDVHLQQHGDRVSATFSDDITVAGKTGHVDLCEDCELEFAGPVIALVRDYGSPVGTVPAPAKSPTKAPPAGGKPAKTGAGGRPAASELKVKCPVCAGPYKNRSSLSVHIQKEHGVTLAVAEGGGDHVRLPCPQDTCQSIMRSGPALIEHVVTHHDGYEDFDWRHYVASLPEQGGLEATRVAELPTGGDQANGTVSPQAAQQELVGASA